MPKKIRLLFVDDEKRFLDNLAARLSLRDFTVVAVDNGQDALAKAREHDFDVALIDLRMPGMGGEELLAKLKEEHPLLEVVILTGHGSVDSAVECTKAGSYGYLQKPCELDELLVALRDAYKNRLKRKYEVGDTELRKAVGLALTGAPLQVLLRLREIDEEGL